LLSTCPPPSTVQYEPLEPRTARDGSALLVVGGGVAIDIFSTLVFCMRPSAAVWLSVCGCPSRVFSLLPLSTHVPLAFTHIAPVCGARLLMLSFCLCFPHGPWHLRQAYPGGGWFVECAIAETRGGRQSWLTGWVGKRLSVCAGWDGNVCWGLYQSSDLRTVMCPLLVRCVCRDPPCSPLPLRVASVLWVCSAAAIGA